MALKGVPGVTALVRDADLTALAKILAGGFPGGAVGGRAEIMDMIGFRDDPEWNEQHRVAHPGTFNANPICAAAGSRCLELLGSSPLSRQACDSAILLRQGLNQVFRSKGISGLAYGFGSMVWIAFGVDYDGDLDCCTVPHDKLARAQNAPEVQVVRRALLNAGVDAMRGCWFILSALHTERDIDDTLQAFEKALSQMRAEAAI